MPVGGAPVFTALDCAFLQQFAGGTQTSDLTEEQKSGIADLQKRLLDAAAMVADQLSADWRPFKSEVKPIQRQRPRGQTALVLRISVCFAPQVVRVAGRAHRATQRHRAVLLPRRWCQPV